MISKDDQKRLIALCDHFINSGDDVILAHLLDALKTVIPDVTIPATRTYWETWRMEH